MTTLQPTSHRPARGPGDRGALVGLRQLRHPVQGLRHPRHPAHREEKIADAATVHRFTGLAPTVALHIPWDQVDDYAALRVVRRGPRRRARHDQLQHLPGRRLQARRPDPHRPEGPAEGDRPPLRVHRRHGRDRVARPQDLAGRGHQLPRPGRHARPPGPAGRGPRARSTTGIGDDQRLVLEYKFFEPAFYHTDVPDWGTSYAHVAALGDRAVRLPRHRPPRARAPTSSSSSPSCCGSGSSARSTSTAASTPTTT